MAKKARTLSKEEEAEVVNLAQVLRTSTSHESILESLDLLTKRLEHPQKQDSVATVFLRESGLPTLIDHLGGTTPLSPTDDEDTIRAAIADKAAAAVRPLLHTEHVIMPVMEAATDIMGPLIDILEDGRLENRVLAGELLALHAMGQAAVGRAMAEEGVIGLALDLFVDIHDSPQVQDLSRPLAGLAFMLGTYEAVAAEDLEEAICAPEVLTAFAAMTILQSTNIADPGDEVGGIVDALVATLDSESPFCVAAAAGALSRVFDYLEVGEELIADSGAIPALLEVVKRKMPPGDLKNLPAIFHKPVFNCECVCPNGALRFNNPTALALVGLNNPYTDQLLDIFLESGGISVLTDVLKEYSCPLSVRYSAELIEGLLDADVQGKWDSDRQLADQFFHAGLCPAALAALRIQDIHARKQVLDLLATFFSHLSSRFHSAATGQLVAGKGVELIVCVIAAGGMYVASPGLGMLHHFVGDPQSRERMFKQGVASQLIHCISKWLLEAEGHMLVAATQILTSLLLESTDPIPATIKANLPRGLLRVLRELLTHPEIVASSSTVSHAALCYPVTCLSTIMWSRTDNPTAAWKPLLDAGIVPLLTDLVALGSEDLMAPMGRLISSLLLVTPPGEAPKYLGRLPRALAGLIKARPPVAPEIAADALFFMALNREELLDDYHSWGMGPSLKRLTKHKDPHTVSAAEHLLLILKKGKHAAVADLRKSMLAEGVTLPDDRIEDLIEEIRTLHTTPNCRPSRSEHQASAAPRPQQATSPDATGDGKHTHGGTSSAPTAGPTQGGTALGHTAEASQGETGSGDTAEPVSRAEPDEAQPAGEHYQEQAAGNPDHTSPVGGAHMGASCGPRAARKVWACACCGKKAEMVEKGKLRECTGCRSVRYCGKECQVAHWPAHKGTCKNLRAARG